MTTLLHLTDLHLDTPDDYAGADFKSDIVPIKDRPDRSTALRTTLVALGASPWKIDAIVLTGDIPFQNGTNTRGWEQFDEALKPLEDAGKLPEPERIVVTPGNHDVAWRKPIGDPAHYREFLEHARTPGYTTPLLDGIDFNDDGQITSTLKHYLLDVGAGLVIVPINSSHYCGALEPLGPTLSDDQWKEALAKLGGLDASMAERVEEQVVSLRAQDVARISEPQFKALTAMVADIKEESARQGTDPANLIWVAAVHHHLLPVSTEEEFKSYESMTNLGRFRQLLIDLGFQVLLHGHKHSGGVYWDRVHRKGASLRDRDPQLLVVSGSTAGSRSEGTQEMARLIELDAAPMIRAVVVSKVPIVDHGARLPDPLLEERAELWQSEMLLERALPRTITGPDVTRVYQRVQALFNGLAAGQAVSDLVCEIRSPQGAGKPPDGYPVDRLPGGPSRAEEWFNETVDWWQRKGSKFQFTHGQRLHAWGPDQSIDQVDEAIRLLQSASTSTRAVITLIDPSIDKVAAEQCKFPSFSLAHLLIRATPGKARALDCLGFFRKQEMRFWWPINVAELARLQALVLRRLDQTDLRLGSIITYSSFAHVGTEVPDVNIAVVDRLADHEQDRLWNMAYGVAHPESVDLEAIKSDWLRVVTDLEPVNGDQLPRPRLGIKMLRECLERFGQPDEGSPAMEIRQHVLTLENTYDAMAKQAGSPAYWHAEVTKALGAIRDQVGRLPSV
jgi:3',5'-cyclic AMP phosphodiesterase CpdA